MAAAKLLMDLPDVIFYLILSYAERPTGIAPFLTRSISVLSREIRYHVENNRNALWEIILCCEYNGNSNPIHSTTTTTNSGPVLQHLLQQGHSIYSNQRRISDRLRRSSAKEDVIFCHKKLCDRTEFAIYQLSEITNDRKNPLTLSKLRSIFRNEGPILRVNLRAKTGGTLLVEVLRSRYVTTDAVILRCVKELIEVHGADPNLPATDGGGQSGRSTLVPPLVIAAGRGLPSVVKYLIQAGACIYVKGTTRFRLVSNPKKTFKGTFTPLEFSKALMGEELHHGATMGALQGLRECIRILTATAEKAVQPHSSALSPSSSPNNTPQKKKRKRSML